VRIVDRGLWAIYLGRSDNVLMIQRGNQHWVEEDSGYLDLLTDDEVNEYFECWRKWIPS